jgi:hypothetical protein
MKLLMTYTLKLTILKSRMIVNVIAAVILGLSLTHLLHPEVPLYSPYGNYYWYFKVHSSGGAMGCIRCPGNPGHTYWKLHQRRGSDGSGMVN